MFEERVSSSRPRVNGTFDVRVMGVTPEDLDAQPVGIIRLDQRGVVLSYNAYEERRARRSRGDVVGKSFFHEIAPCTRVQAFYGRFLEGVARRELDASFGFVFPFPRGDRHVFITHFYQTADDSLWVIIRDTEDASSPA